VTGRQGHERIRRVALAGASGYTGVELLRLLLQHPLAKVVALTADTHANQPIGKVFPSLTGFLDLTCLPLDTSKLAAEAEFVFLALPHKTSMAVGADLIQRGARVLDLSADYRLKDAAAYPRWYGVQHVAPHLLKEAAYGLPELHRAAIAGARLVAVPGCYPTGAVLGLEIFFEQWDFGRSAPAEETLGGVPTGFVVYEPESRTRSYGLRSSVNRAF